MLLKVYRVMDYWRPPEDIDRLHLTYVTSQLPTSMKQEVVVFSLPAIFKMDMTLITVFSIIIWLKKLLKKILVVIF